MTVQDEVNQRRVRPWIAALLTLLGLGLGLYYARRTRAALWLIVLSTLVGIALGVALLGFALYSDAAPAALFDQSAFNVLNVAGWIMTLIIAIGVWFAVSKRQFVPKAGPARLLGYLAIWLLPTVFSVCVAMALRFATYQPFHIPSGAMQPTLLVGDYVVVSKWSYGYSRFSIAPFEGLAPHGRWRAHDPVRGDIIVFRPVPEPGRDFVKRLVGMPGDRIQMIDGVLHINGAAVAREALGEQTFNTDGVTFTAQAYRETLPNGVSYTTLDRGVSELDNTRVYVVPAGSYFFMGDDRDNSADSRVPSVIGYVPFENLIGRVDRVLHDES